MKIHKKLEKILSPFNSIQKKKNIFPLFFPFLLRGVDKNKFKICLYGFRSYTVQPRLGYISGNFQIILIRFNGKSESGIYEEDLKIFYNSPSNFECVRLKTLVEMPELIFGNNNSYKFECTFPGSKTEAIIPVQNPTNLYLR